MSGTKDSKGRCKTGYTTLILKVSSSGSTGPIFDKLDLAGKLLGSTTVWSRY